MTYFGQFHDDPYYMTAEEEAKLERHRSDCECDSCLDAKSLAEARSIGYCKCAFTDPDGTLVPGEPCEIHPEVKQ